jgi:opacity protein-like surface antigen
MRKSIVIGAAVLASAFVAAATDYPSSQLFLGYNLTRFYPDSVFIPDLNAEGGNAQFTYNFSKFIGATFDIGSVTKGTINHQNWDTTATSFTVGPRFTYHNHSRFTPYVQVLFGGSEFTTSTEVGNYVTPPLPTPHSLPPGINFTTRIDASQSGFGMLVGGGLDIKIFKRMAFRPFGLDYYLARLPSVVTGNDTNHNNLRYTAGVSFLFGKK